MLTDLNAELIQVVGVKPIYLKFGKVILIKSYEYFTICFHKIKLNTSGENVEPNKSIYPQ